MLKLPSSKLTPLLSPLALGLSLVMAMPALANPEHGRGHDKAPLRQVLAKLELNQAQHQDVKQIVRQSRADASLLAADVQQAKTELVSLIHADNWDASAVATALAQNQQTKASLGLEKASTMHQIWLLLTDEQKAKFTQLADKHQAAKGHKKFKHDNSDRSARQRNGQFAGLNLSDEQKTAIKTIKQQAKAEHQDAREAKKTFHEAERALITSTAFNEAAYQALQAEYQDEHLQHALLVAKTRHDIWNVLSAEQQAQALEKMAERKVRT